LAYFQEVEFFKYCENIKLAIPKNQINISMLFSGKFNYQNFEMIHFLDFNIYPIYFSNRFRRFLFLRFLIVLYKVKEFIDSFIAIFINGNI